jgi:two-component system, cell cycle response regulator CpdR
MSGVESTPMAKILIVEDDESMNEILVSTLSEEDHEVQSAFNGPNALELCETNQFDLVVTDVRLPGIDGVEMFHKLRALLPKVKCIVITGYASEDTPVRAIRLKIDDYLFKPFSLRYFLQAVDRALHEEQEKKEKRALFSKLFARFGLNTATPQEKALEALVEERQDAFRGLYVGIRSAYLSERASLEMYTKLELLESKFRTLVHKKDADTSRLNEVGAMYSSIKQRLEGFKSGKADEAPRTGVVSTDEFTPLFRAILDSEISFEDLLYAPLLRKTPDSRFETLGELLELKRKLWPDSAAS